VIFEKITSSIKVNFGCIKLETYIIITGLISYMHARMHTHTHTQTHMHTRIKHVFSMNRFSAGWLVGWLVSGISKYGLFDLCEHKNLHKGRTGDRIRSSGSYPGITMSPALVVVLFNKFNTQWCNRFMSCTSPFFLLLISGPVSERMVFKIELYLIIKYVHPSIEI
jgi:hypothetical protein